MSDTLQHQYSLTSGGYMGRFTKCGHKKICIYEHREVWEAAHGLIPAGHHIHHKNKNRRDNRLENLECIEARAHLRAHGLDPSMVRHLANQREGWPMRTVDCFACDKVFQVKHPLAKFCSSTCRTKYRNWINDAGKAARRAEARGEKPCTHCGTVFLQAYSCQNFCRPRCQAIYHSRAQAARAGHKPTPSMYRAS